jgi:hypothetical protein
VTVLKSTGKTKPGISITKAKKKGPSDVVKDLHVEGFFKEEKKLDEIRKKLQSKGFNFGKSSVFMALEGAEYLKKNGKKGKYKFIKNIQQKDLNLRVSLSVSKVADPKQEIEEKILTEQLKKLSEGESPLEILFLVQLRESAKTVDEIKNKLDMHVEAMINNLEVIHQVKARRIAGTDMMVAILYSKGIRFVNRTGRYAVVK